MGLMGRVRYRTRLAKVCRGAAGAPRRLHSSQEDPERL